MSPESILYRSLTDFPIPGPKPESPLLLPPTTLLSPMSPPCFFSFLLSFHHYRHSARPVFSSAPWRLLFLPPEALQSPPLSPLLCSAASRRKHQTQIAMASLLLLLQPRRSLSLSRKLRRLLLLQFTQPEALFSSSQLSKTNRRLLCVSPESSFSHAAVQRRHREAPSRNPNCDSIGCDDPVKTRHLTRPSSVQAQLSLHSAHSAS